MSAAKSPAELIADLTDQARLLRQDVGNLPATATSKAKAAKLRASVQKITIDALEQNRQIASTAVDMSCRMHRDSLTAAQEAAGQAVRGLGTRSVLPPTTCAWKPLKAASRPSTASEGVWPSSGELRPWEPFWAS